MWAQHLLYKTQIHHFPKSMLKNNERNGTEMGACRGWVFQSRPQMRRSCTLQEVPTEPSKVFPCPAPAPVPDFITVTLLLPLQMAWPCLLCNVSAKKFREYSKTVFTALSIWQGNLDFPYSPPGHIQGLPSSFLPRGEHLYSQWPYTNISLPPIVYGQIYCWYYTVSGCGHVATMNIIEYSHWSLNPLYSVYSFLLPC